MAIKRDLETVDSPSTIQPALRNNFGQTRLNFMRMRRAREEESPSEPLTKEAKKESAFPTFGSTEWCGESDRYSVGAIAKIREGRLDTSEAEEAWMASEARFLGENKAHETHVAKIVEELISVIDSADEGNPLLPKLETIYELAVWPMSSWKDRQESAREKHEVFLARAAAKFEHLYEQTQGWDLSGVNGEDFVREMVKCLPDVEALLQMPNYVGVNPGSDLMMFLARHVHGDLDTKGGAGYGCHTLGYQQLDAMMMRIIDRRGARQERIGGEDIAWISQTVMELEKKRDHLAKYGLEVYFPNSLARLQGMEVSPVQKPKAEKARTSDQEPKSERARTSEIWSFHG